MPSIPYTTKTGLQIGKYYEKPKYIEQDSDMILLQSYLIYDPALINKKNLVKKIYLMFITLLLCYLLVIS